MSAVETINQKSILRHQIATLSILNEEVESSLDFYFKNAQNVAKSVYRISEQFLPKPERLAEVIPIGNHQHPELMGLLSDIEISLEGSV